MKLNIEFNNKVFCGVYIVKKKSSTETKVAVILDDKSLVYFINDSVKNSLYDEHIITYSEYEYIMSEYDIIKRVSEISVK